jgi:lipoyl(octanoyl) transferase
MLISVVQLGTVDYALGLRLQEQLVALRKEEKIGDVLLLLEHKPVITLGRNANTANVVASRELLIQRGVGLFECDRGGDVTFHGPGQIVGYPIFDLREWKRDVVAYVRTLEQVIVDALAEFGIEAGRVPGCTGVWIDEKKVAAIGVHISRWVTSHGFALNHTTDLTYFQYIVPCGLTKPVTSMRELGSGAGRDEVISAVARNFSMQFQSDLLSQGRPVPELTETFQ